MAALSRAVIGANSALSAALTSVLPSAEGELLRERQDGEMSALRAFTIAATAVESFAAALLELLEDSLSLRGEEQSRVSGEDQSFAYLVCASGAAILDCGSRACASVAFGLPPSHLRNHAVGLRRLVRCLDAMAGAQPGALKVLRATTCSPDAVLACLRRHFLQYRGDGQGAEGRPAAGPALPSAALEASALSGPFLPCRRLIPKPGKRRRRQLHCGDDNSGLSFHGVCGRARCHWQRC